MTRDITEDIPLNIGNPGTSSFWINDQEAYDVAIGGIPFIMVPTDRNPYQRQTAPYRKDQFDSSKEPGEQSLTGWWIRSQSSFHAGAGIKFYDPSSGETIGYRYADSQGVDVFTKGQVTLLHDVIQGHNITSAIATTGLTAGVSTQHVRSITWNSTNGVLLHDGYDVDKIDSAGAAVHFIDYNSGTSEPVYAICDDGVYAYWVTNQVSGGANKMHMFKKPLTGDSSTGYTYPTLFGDVTKMFDATGIVITRATMEWVKDRIVLCMNNVVYEIAPNATALPSAVYTNPNTNYVYTGVAASGPAIYTSGFSGLQSTIQKYSLVASSGNMPTLSAASVAAEMPTGEIIHRIYYYLGYMIIGTSRGVRVAIVNDQDGSLDYGPLIVETPQPVYDFAARDRFVWCASGIGADAGIIRLDLGQSIEQEHLRFAYANDLQVVGSTGHNTTSVAFLGSSDKLAFTTAADASAVVGYVYVEDPVNLRTSGYVTSGAIRFGTLEPKNFKFVRARGDYSNGSLDIQTIEENGDVYNVITYNSTVGTPEAATTQPEGSQELMSYKFTLSRSATNTALGPIFKGFQTKALPATKRQRLIQFPVWCFDVETDRYKVQSGYTGRAWERIQLFEDLEASGDVVNIQDFTTGERVRGIIDLANFTRSTPPYDGYDGFGGILNITVRTIS